MAHPQRALLFGQRGRVVKVLTYDGNGFFTVLEVRGKTERRVFVHRDRLTFLPDPPSSPAEVVI